MNEQSKLLSPEELASRFLPEKQPSTPEEEEGYKTIITLTMQVSKIRIQELFEKLSNLLVDTQTGTGDPMLVVSKEDIDSLRKEYQRLGVLYADEIPVHQLTD